ncbi:MAG: PorT family protein [Firmicutes bacterium]|nr:PorT family protein [Bacillota bacterium]MCM1402086.1 PorT family protein [Bacteroides sp.]
MKKALIILAVVITSLSSALSTSAQFRFGLKAGVAINSLHFNEDAFNADNRAGFTGGAMIEFTVPLVGVGFDLSAMYVRRNSQWMEANNITKDNRDYIDIPLNLKWKMNIPVINNIIRPYLLTGPSFSFLTSKRSAEAAWRNRKFDTSWNFGAGVELLKRLQVGASYSIGMTKALKTVGVTGTSNIEGHNRYWTVTAAYLF